jgi:hypothetical protein
MNNIQKLISISSEGLDAEPKACPNMFREYTLGLELFHMLQQKNGFYAFEYALHVFPLTADPEGGVEGWNAEALWRNGYEDLAEGLLFFAEDILQDQFCLSKKRTAVYRFHAETGETSFIAASIEGWAGAILSDYRTQTCWPLVHEWQEKNGRLPLGKRLMPKTPFFLGGEYKLENLWAGNPLEGMRLKAGIAMQTRNLPEGAKVRLKIAEKPD